MSVERNNSLKVVTLEPTPFCNQSCKTCNTWKLTRNKDFVANHKTKEKFPLSSVVEQASQMGVEHINLAGAEPFAYEGTIGLIRLIKSKGIECSLVSNGSLIDRNIAEELVDARIDAIRFSVDGPIEEVHDFIRGNKGAYRKVISAIRSITEYGATQNYIPDISFNSTISKLNINEPEGLVFLAHELGVKKINFGLAIQVNSKDVITTNENLGLGVTSEQFLRVGDNIAFTANDIEILKESFEKAKLASQGLGIVHNVEVIKKYLSQPESIVSGRYLSDLMENKAVSCGFPYMRTLIDVYGNVYPCSPIRKIMGNLKDEDLDTIWNGKSYVEFREKFEEQGYFPICMSCCNLNRKGGSKI